jgi:cold-inducible RNA-binding protein
MARTQAMPAPPRESDERGSQQTTTPTSLDEFTERGIAMKNLYVGNLSNSTTEAELRNVFEAHGAVEKITLVTDRDTGRSRGFGFVEMTNASEADKAIAALNGTDLGGRTLTINEAKPKSDRSRSDSHRFGGQGSRGRDDYRGHPRQPREPRW